VTRPRISIPAVILVCCLVATLALLLWPQGATAPRRAPAERYSGPLFQAREGGPVAEFPLALTSPGAVSPEAPPATPTPALVGVAGRSAYLRDASTGEVVRVPVGGSLGGWRVVSVSSRRAVLDGPSGRTTVELFAIPRPDASSAPGPESLPAPVGPAPTPAPSPTPPQGG